MGYVSVPPPSAVAQAAAGRGAAALVAHGELDAGELRGVIAKLREVLRVAQAGPAAAGSLDGALTARLAQLSLASSRGAGGQPAAVAVTAVTTAAAPPPVPLRPAAAAAPPAPPMPAPAPAAAPLAAAAPAGPAAVAAAPSPPSMAAWIPQAAAPAQPVQAPPQQQQAPPTAAPARQPEPAAAAAAHASAAWTQCFASDPSDHANNPVSALAYIPRLPGLPGGDGHMGWLVSASRNLINLFECNAGGGAKGEPSLMLMHAQEVDFVCTRLAVEARLGLMFAVSLSTDNAGREGIAVNSLDVERLLAYQYRFAPPDNPRRPAGGEGGARLINHVASLAPVGGALGRCCVASYGGRLVVFEAPATPPAPGTTLTQVRSSWDAHPGASITALHLATAGPVPMLFSGANDGAIAGWDMRARPTAPKVVMRGHARNVTGVSLLHDACLASCGIDGKLLLWDPRRTESPYAAVVPDGSPALRLAPSPFGDCLAVSTNRGLHAVDLVDGDHGTAPIAPFPLQRPFSDIAWNAGTGEVYASSHAGSVCVFARGL